MVILQLKNVNSVMLIVYHAKKRLTTVTNVNLLSIYRQLFIYFLQNSFFNLFVFSTCILQANRDLK